ncbi:MAG TPA: ThiF family adenylyltransferase, partial [Burkholderiales bacterium]|nr:ThiF family adenylyltransferase [Burkholderiales bacterium]
MNDEQLLRYSRHILLSEFGIEGQERLRAASALIVGAGGLGCPAALYLAASGIGRLTIADGDKVDLTNLQRQILYRAESVGAVKVEAARQSLNAVNPEVDIVSVQKRLDAASL